MILINVLHVMILLIIYYFQVVLNMKINLHLQLIILKKLLLLLIVNKWIHLILLNVNIVKLIIL